METDVRVEPDAGTAEPSDAALLRAHVAGDPAAFGELFARHRGRLWAVALRTMGNPEDAADGLQDGMVAAFRRAASFRGESQVTTWLHRVVVNACLDRLRAMKVRHTDSLPDDLEEYGDRGSLVSSTPVTTDPVEVTLVQERRRQVLAALATLSGEQRAALVLVDMEGYPVAEAAEILGCAVGTVKSRCARGRARLAVLLVDLVGEPDAGSARVDPTGNPPGPGAVPSVNPPRGPPLS